MSHQEVQAVVDAAIREAFIRRHEYITVEHLLYSLLQHETGSVIIRQCGGNVDRLLQELIRFFSDQLRCEFFTIGLGDDFRHAWRIIDKIAVNHHVELER